MVNPQGAFHPGFTLSLMLWLSTMFGKGFMVMLLGRVIAALINIPLQSYIVSLLLRHLRRLAIV